MFSRRSCSAFPTCVFNLIALVLSVRPHLIMAKSLRSKSKLRAKNIKRKGEFEQLNKARQERIAQKLTETMEKQKEETMEDDAPKTESDKKVSTSGWRTLRKQEYIVKKLKGKKKSSIKF